MKKWIWMGLMPIALAGFAGDRVKTVRVSIENELPEPVLYRSLTINQDTRVRHYPSASIGSMERKEDDLVVYSMRAATTRTVLQYEVLLPAEFCDGDRPCTKPIELFWQTNMGIIDEAGHLSSDICGSTDSPGIQVTCPIPMPNADDPTVLEIAFRISR